MKIKDIFINKTSDNNQFDTNGKNWFIVIKLEDDRRFGVELKPEMSIVEIAIEFVKFTNLLITKASE